MKMNAETDVLFVIDVQDPFMNSIADGANVLKRVEFTVRAAAFLGVPIVATEQVPEKLGRLAPTLESALGETPVYAKTSFSCLGCPQVLARLHELGRKNAVLIGAETHICVAQTGLDLLTAGFKVAVCPDAVGASSVDRHKLGMERLRDSGVMPVHSEGLVYEWMASSEHPAFRDVLKLVKRFA